MVQKFKDGLGGAVRRGQPYRPRYLGGYRSNHSCRKGHKIAESMGTGVVTGIANGISAIPWRTIGPDSDDFMNHLVPEGQSPAGKYAMRVPDAK